MDKQKRELSCCALLVLVLTEDFILKLFAPILVTGNVEPLKKRDHESLPARTTLPLLSVSVPVCVWISTLVPRTLSSPSNLEIEINLINTNKIMTNDNNW